MESIHDDLVMFTPMSTTHESNSSIKIMTEGFLF